MASGTKLEEGGKQERKRMLGRWRFSCEGSKGLVTTTIHDLNLALMSLHWMLFLVNVDIELGVAKDR